MKREFWTNLVGFFQRHKAFAIGVGGGICFMSWDFFVNLDDEAKWSFLRTMASWLSTQLSLWVVLALVAVVVVVSVGVWLVWSQGARVSHAAQKTAEMVAANAEHSRRWKDGYQQYSPAPGTVVYKSCPGQDGTVEHFVCPRCYHNPKRDVSPAPLQRLRPHDSSELVCDDCGSRYGGFPSISDHSELESARLELQSLRNQLLAKNSNSGLPEVLANALASSPDRPQNRLPILQEKIIEMLGHGPQSPERIFKEVKKRKADVEPILNQLLELGYIQDTRCEGSGGPVWEITPKGKQYDFLKHWIR